MRAVRYPIFLFLVLSFAGCKKDELTRRELITAHPWKVVDVYVTAKPDNSVQNYTAFYACNLDDIWSFKATGTYTRDEGAKKCNWDDKAVSYGYWQLEQQDTQLNWKLDDNTLEFPDNANVKTVVALNKNEMVLEQVFRTSSDFIMTIKFKAL